MPERHRQSKPAEKSENPVTPNTGMFYIPSKNGPEAARLDPETEAKLLKQRINGPNVVYLMNVGQVIDKELQSKAALFVQGKYGPRVLALMTGSGVVIIGEDTPEDFMNYQAHMRGYDIAAHKLNFHDPYVRSPIQALKNRLQGKEIRAYMPQGELVHEMQELGGTVAGFNEQSIKTLEKLNNKYQIASWLRSDAARAGLLEMGLIDEHTNSAPHAEEYDQDDLLTGTKRRLEEINTLYKDNDSKMRSYFEEKGADFKGHNAKVIIRPSWGGGSYETFTVEQVNTEDGPKYKIGHEGKEFNKDNWNDVEDFVKEQFSQNGASDKYTVTRYVKKVEDPGINGFIVVDEETDPNSALDKLIYVAPAHGQVMSGTMCVGTKTSNPPSPKALERLYFDGSSPKHVDNRKDKMDKARDITAFIVNEMAKDATGSVMMGVDVILTDMFEAALADAVKGTDKEYEAVGEFVIAEANMRPTQRTMHQLTQEAIKNNVYGRANEPVTWKQLIQSYEPSTNDTLFTSLDAHHVTRAGWRRLMEMSRSDYIGPNLLAGINGSDTGIYILMPPVNWEANEDISSEQSTMGIGIMGKNEEDLKRLLLILDGFANGVDHEKTPVHHL